VLELVHVGRSIGLGTVKTALGAGLCAVDVTGMSLLARVGLGAVIAALVPALWLVDWGSLMVLDGVTDVIARLRTGDSRPGLAMILSADGVRVSPRYPGSRSLADLTVGWDEVTGAAFRRGPAGSLWFCLDTPSPLPAPGPDMVLSARNLPVERVPRLVTLWINTVIGRDDPPELRRLLANMFWFGTPLAVNLAVCPGGSLARVDRFLARHTPGGIRCVSPEREWWRPPPLTRYLSPIGARSRNSAGRDPDAPA
jgi:hypothetical protein